MYSQTGSYLAIAGLIVTVLAHFGVSTTTEEIATIIGSAIALYGIIHQFVAHKALAQSAGVYPNK